MNSKKRIVKYIITKNGDLPVTKTPLKRKVLVYNGNRHESLELNKNILGNPLGSLTLTKKMGKSIHDSERNMLKNGAKNLTPKKSLKTVSKKKIIIRNKKRIVLKRYSTYDNKKVLKVFCRHTLSTSFLMGKKINLYFAPITRVVDNNQREFSPTYYVFKFITNLSKISSKNSFKIASYKKTIKMSTSKSTFGENEKKNKQINDESVINV